MQIKGDAIEKGQDNIDRLCVYNKHLVDWSFFLDEGFDPEEDEADGDANESDAVHDGGDPEDLRDITAGGGESAAAAAALSPLLFQRANYLCKRLVAGDRKA